MPSSSSHDDNHQRVISIENVELLKTAGGPVPPSSGNHRHRHRRSESFGSYNSDYNDADSHTGSGKQQQREQSARRHANMHQQQQQQQPPSMTAAQAAAAAASSAAYEYQQQQAYYAQQFYYQQQQQAQYHGVAGYGASPWPAPQPFHGTMVPQQQQPATYRRTNSQEKPKAATSLPPPPDIQITMSNGSEQDDEYIALLQRNLSQVGGQASGKISGGVAGGGGGYGATSTSSRQPQPQSPKHQTSNGLLAKGRQHRRAQSEGMFSTPSSAGATRKSLQKTQSQSNEKPPMNKSPRILPKTTTGIAPKKKSRHGRSLSSGGLPHGATLSNNSPTLPSFPRQHRRTNSNVSVTSSVGAASVASEASFMSITTDIRKSTFYGGVDRTSGRVQLHYPNEQIYICVQDQTTNDEDASDQNLKNHSDGPPRAGRGLELGKVYAVVHDPEDFEEYHRLAEDAMWEDDLQDIENNHHHTTRTCGCKCHVCRNNTGSSTTAANTNSCGGCVGHESNVRKHKKSIGDPLFGALPVNKFALAVDPTVYRRVLDEIGQAQQMPCGLFFCGHHEDVAHPSIQIAVVMVVILFAAMAFVAFVLQV